MTDTTPTVRGVRRPFPLTPESALPDKLRVALVGERDPVMQLAMICDHLRPRLVSAARRAGAADWADDVVSEVVARRFRIVVADAPITLATPRAFNHLTASLLVSVRNQALTRRRDEAREQPVSADRAATLAGVDEASGADADTDVASTDEIRALAEALRGLSPRDAQIARLIGVHDLTVRDVAERLGIPSSTVHDVWSRIQRTIRVEVQQVLSGAVCRQAAPHLALISSQHRSDRSGDEDTSLTDVVGVDLAHRLISHVFGSGDTLGGCQACRRALARQRMVLQHGLPSPLVGVAGVGAESNDWGRELLARLWNAVTTVAARMSDAVWSLGGAAPLPTVEGAATTTIGVGTAKIATLIAASALASSAPTVVTTLRSHQHPSRTRVVDASTHSPGRPASSVTRRPASTAAQTHVARGGGVMRRSAPLSTSTQATHTQETPAATPRSPAQTRAAAEFTPGP